jgi:hypothetical protein
MGERQFALPFFIYRREKEMHSFVDGKGREYKLRITIGSAKNYREKIDIIDAEPSTIIERMAGDMSLRLDMLWHFLDNKDVVECRDDFENSLEGTVLFQADEALWSELAFFIQSLRPAMSDVVDKLMEKYHELTKRQAEIVLKVANSLDLEKASNTLEKEAMKIMGEAQDQILKEFTM